MIILGRRGFIGARVLFVWNNIPFTGVISSIAIKTYGIICDTDKYTTDRLMIPRMQDEIYVPKTNCKLTDEISPIVYENGDWGDACAGGIELAYHHLPKRTIYPFFGDRMKQIDFIPGKTIFKLDDGDYYLYINYSSNERLVTLINMKDGVNEYKIPEWKYQKTSGCCNKRSKSINEINIDKVYMIPDVKSYHSVKTLFTQKKLNLVYDAMSAENAPITHSFREYGDVDPQYIPKETLFNFGITK